MSQFDKIMIFIDGSNVFRSCRDLKIKISYEKFLLILRKDRNVIRTYYYSGIKSKSQEKGKFFKMLKGFGVEIKTKLLKKRDVTCRSCGEITNTYVEKGIDASLSTDLLWHAFQKSYDIGIVVSADADYIPPIERVRDLGRRIELWAFKHTLGRELKNKADIVNYIDDVIDKIQYP